MQQVSPYYGTELKLFLQMERNSIFTATGGLILKTNERLFGMRFIVNIRMHLALINDS